MHSDKLLARLTRVTKVPRRRLAEEPKYRLRLVAKKLHKKALKMHKKHSTSLLKLQD